MGVFAGVKEAKEFGSGSWFSAGFDGLVNIKAIKQFESAKKRGRTNFVVECIIAESNSDKDPVDAERTWVTHTGFDSFLANVKGFVRPLMGVGDEGVTEALCESLCTEDQPAEGFPIRLSTQAIVTGGGNDFTKHVWSAAEKA